MSAGPRAPGTVRTMSETQPRRVGVMGGTFDPIHNGHLVAASEVQACLGLDEVVFAPAGDPWHKAGQHVSPAEDRYLMTVIATASNPSFRVSRADIDRGTPTYTMDTLTDLSKEYPGADLYFITGADVISQICTWDRAEGIFDLAHFVGCTRPGYVLDDAEPAGAPQGRTSFVEVPALAISSTDVRERAQRGEPVWYLVPDGVVQYIAKHRLYAPKAQSNGPRNGPSPADMCTTVEPDGTTTGPPGSYPPESCHPSKLLPIPPYHPGHGVPLIANP